MKAFDFFCMNPALGRRVLIGLMICYSGLIFAAPPVDYTFTSSNELILNLSDKWLEPQASLESDLQNSQSSANKGLATNKKANKKANIGCNMDVSELSVDDDSMTSRLEGKCNFDYRY
jgi:hypothetical protein